MANKKQIKLWQRRNKRFWHRLRLALVPHAHNQYRPRLIRRYGLLTVLVLVVGVQCGYNISRTGSVLGQVTTVTPQALLLDTNDERHKEGLPELALQPQLAQAAQRKAQDMIQQGYWSHTAPDGTEPWYWIDQTGYTYVEAGENLAKNFTTAPGVVSAWMDSPAHRANVLKDSYKEVGFGVAQGEVDGKLRTVVVALYGAPAPSVVAVAGAQYHEAAAGGRVSLATRMGVALQSLTPAALTSLALLFVAATVAIVSHSYRKRLPKRLQQSWYRHHGVIKASGLFTAAAVVVLLYGGGQI